MNDFRVTIAVVIISRKDRHMRVPPAREIIMRVQYSDGAGMMARDVTRARRYLLSEATMRKALKILIKGRRRDWWIVYWSHDALGIVLGQAYSIEDDHRSPNASSLTAKEIDCPGPLLGLWPCTIAMYQ